jgi:excisionase family DNA binding protein
MGNDRTPAEQQSLIPAKELCERLQISRRTLGRLVRAKIIGFYRVGGRLMFDEKILDEFKAASFHPPVVHQQEAA